MSSEKKKIRQNFRDSVFRRDGHKCVFCERKDELDAHHITDRTEMPNGGYVKENGISLCPEHHMQAEKFHISGGAVWHTGMHPNDLYIKIGSSKEKAIEASNRLKQFCNFCFQCYNCNLVNFYKEIIYDKAKFHGISFDSR